MYKNQVKIYVNPSLSAPFYLHRLGQFYLNYSCYISEGSKYIYSSQRKVYMPSVRWHTLEPIIINAVIQCGMGKRTV